MKFFIFLSFIGDSMSSSSSTENANFTIELDKESLKSYEVKSNRLDTSTVNVKR